MPGGAGQHGRRNQERDGPLRLSYRSRSNGPRHRGWPLLCRPRQGRNWKDRRRKENSSGTPKTRGRILSQAGDELVPC
jgi:hypothetical protein